jgi:hypothetical protein
VACCLLLVGNNKSTRHCCCQQLAAAAVAIRLQDCLCCCHSSSAAFGCVPAFVVMKFLLLVSPMMGFSVRGGTGAFSFSLGLLGEVAACHAKFAGQQM